MFAVRFIILRILIHYNVHVTFKASDSQMDAVEGALAMLEDSTEARGSKCTAIAVHPAFAPSPKPKPNRTTRATAFDDLWGSPSTTSAIGLARQIQDAITPPRDGLRHGKRLCIS